MLKSLTVALTMALLLEGSGASASGAANSTEAAYWAVVARYARGEKALALAAIRAFTDSDLDAIPASVEGRSKDAQKCTDCEARSRFNALPLRAAVLLHSEQDRMTRMIGPRGSDGRPDCRGGAPEARSQALLKQALLQTGGAEFVAQYSVALAIHFRAMFCLAQARAAVETGLKAEANDPILLLVSGMVHETMGILGAGPRVMAGPGADPFLRNVGTLKMREAQLEANHRKELTEARKDLLSAPEQDPGLSAARLRLGRVEWRLGNLEAATGALKRVVADHDPSTLFLGHLFLGAALEDLGSLGEAVAEYEAARALKPDAQLAGIALAHALSMRGEASRARELLAPLLGPGPKTRVNYYWDYLVGAPAMAEGRFEELRRELSP